MGHRDDEHYGVEKIIVKEKKVHTCIHCETTFEFMKDFHSHMISIHDDRGDNQCDRCSYRSWSLSRLKVHIASTHEGIKRHRCQFCGHGFDCKKSLTNHELIHKGEKPYGCQHCEYKTRTQDLLTAHIAAKHTTEKPFQCDLCAKRYALRDLLHKHVKVTHSDAKPFKCDTCE